MSWMTELSDVYDLIVKNADPLDDEKPLPLYHTQNNAQVTVILDGKGNFLDAKLVDPKNRAERATCMPCTEESSNRAGAVVSPYPLCEKFEYAAGDYAQYGEGRNLSEKYEAYSKQLSAWAGSEYSDDEVKSVATYIAKGTLLTDLITKAKIFTVGSDGKLVDKLSDFVRWEVQQPGSSCSEVWKNTSVQQLWIQYYEAQGKDQGLCYVTGKQGSMLRMHPAKLRNSGDKAKIISSNDDQNFTYLGRFEEAAQACQISSEVSLKAHNALRYLISKQGTRVGDGLTVVSWNSSDTKHLPIVASGSEVLHFIQPEQKIEYSTGKEFADSLTKSIHGYYKDCSDADKVMVMMLNAATPGRMSVLLYRELKESDFVKSLEEWHKQMSWYCSFWQQSDDGTAKGQTVYTISSPSPKQIAMTAFGDHYKPAQYEKTVELLIPCILDGKRIPQGIEQRCFAAVSKLGVYDSESARQTYLNTACSVYKYNHREEDYKVALETERHTRDYLYGRLLAVADALERAALKKQNASRDTNAVRYMQRFSRRPASTWKILYEKLTPYKKQIEPGLAAWFEKFITEITSSFKADDYVCDLPLSGEYLLGYQCQIKDFYKGKNDSEQEEK